MSGSATGTKLADLTRPYRGTRSNSYRSIYPAYRFTHPGVSLAANTTYWIVVEKRGSGAMIGRTTDTSEHDSGVAGWSIADTAETRAVNSSGSFSSSASPMRMSIYALPSGVANPAASPIVLVDNTGETREDSIELDSSDVAQAFTTGTHTAGYTLTSVELRLNSSDSTDTDLAAPIVKLISGTAPHTGTATTLTGPASIVAATGGVYTFAAPANTALAASTTYWILVEVASSGGDDVKWEYTVSNDENAAATGWSIGNGYHVRLAGSTGALTEFSNFSMMLRVNGIPVGGI